MTNCEECGSFEDVCGCALPINVEKDLPCRYASCPFHSHPPSHEHVWDGEDVITGQVPVEIPTSDEKTSLRLPQPKRVR